MDSLKTKPDLDYIIVTNTIKRPLSLVERSLRGSLGQKIKPRKVILIDQNPIPVELPEDILSNPLFERQKAECGSVSAARNSLKIPPDVKWIFFCDDDGYPNPGYSDTLLYLIYKHPELDILVGNILRADTTANYTLRQKKGGSLKKFRNTKLLMGSNFVVRSAVFDELGRFDENFGAGSHWGSGEETDFCWKAFFAHKRMEFFKELVVFHVPPFQETLKTGFPKSFKYGVGKGALVWKWLIHKRKVIVLYELIEMFTVPFLLMLRGAFTLKVPIITSNIAAIAGRITGLIKAAFSSF
jgi:hypothetical protein